MPWSPGLILFVDSEDDGKSQVAKQVIQPIAEKIIAKYKAKGEAPLLFFMVEEDDMIDSLRDYTNLPEAMDMAVHVKYMMDVEEISPTIAEAS